MYLFILYNTVVFKYNSFTLNIVKLKNIFVLPHDHLYIF